MANGGRVTAVACVAKLVLFFGKLSVALAATFCFYVSVLMDMQDKLHGVIAPSLVCLAVSYFTADAFNNVFDVHLDYTPVFRRRRDAVLFQPVRVRRAVWLH